MGVPNVKVTMFFVSGTVGWDESHYYTAITALGNPALQAAVVNLMNKRCYCLSGRDAQLVDVRMSIDNINRDTVHIPRDLIPQPNATTRQYTGGPNMTLTNAWAFQSPQVSWPILFDTTDPSVDSLIYVAGMPASIVQFGPGPYDNAGPPAAGAYLTAYATYLATDEVWGALSGRSWSSPTITPLNSLPMTALPTWTGPLAGQPPTIRFSVTWPVGQIPQPGTFIRVGGLTWQTHYNRLRLNGTYKVFAADATTCIVEAKRVTLNPNFNSIGYLQLSTQTVRAYTRFTLRNLTHHKRGRPTYSPRGRVSTAR